MLKILKDNSPFVLSNDISIPWIFRSPFFNDHSSRTGPFKLNSKSLVNQFLLNYPNRLSKKDQSPANIDAELEINSFKKTILLKIQESNENYIKGLILFDNGRFVNTTKDKTLQDFDLGSVFLGNEHEDILGHANSIINLAYPEIGHSFPTMETPDLYGTDNESNPYYMGFANKYSSDKGYLGNHQIAIEQYTFNKNTLIPCLYVFSILDRLFKALGYSFEAYKQIDNPELNTLSFISNRSLDFVEERYNVSLELNQDQICDNDVKTKITFNNIQKGGIYKNESYVDLDNSAFIVNEIGSHLVEFSFDSFLSGFPRIEWEGNPDPTMIKIYLYIGDHEIQYPISEILTYTSYAYHYDVSINCTLDETCLGKPLTVRVCYHDSYDPNNVSEGKISNGTLRIANTSSNSKNRFNSILNYNEHVPKMAVTKFINVIETLTCSIFSFNDNDKTVSIHFWKDILTDINYSNDLGMVVSDSPIINYSNIIKSFNLSFKNGSDIDLNSYFRHPDQNTIPDNDFGSINDIILCIPVNSFFIYRMPEKENEEDPEPLPRWEFLCTNNFNYSIEGFSDLTDEKLIESDTPQMTVINGELIPKIEGTYSPYYSKEAKDQSLSFLFYRGTAPNASNKDYPFATPINLDLFGNKVGDLSLNPNDLIESFYKAYLNWVLRRYSVEIKSHLTFSFLKNISYAKKHRLKGIDFLIDSVEVGMTLKSLTEATIKLYST